MTSDDWRERFPILSDWVGPNADHPLSDPRLPDEARRVWEDLLAPLTSASPSGWEQTRRAFRALRTDADANTREDGALWSRRTELLVAATLIRNNVQFEIRDRPDFVIRGDLGLEVTARVAAKDAPLAQELDWLEHWILAKIKEKSAQAADMPTLLLIDVSIAGKAWLRDADNWAKQLIRLHDRFTPFQGVIVTLSGYDKTEFAQFSAVVQDEALLPSESWSDLKSALNLAKLPTP